MIANFDQFLNEYRGPFSPVSGFSTTPTTPSLKYKFNAILIYNPDNEEKIKDIISKNDIPIDDFNVEPVEAETPFGQIKLQQVDLTFLSHNNYEAASIAKSIEEEFDRKRISYDPNELNFFKISIPERKPIGFKR